MPLDAFCNVNYYIMPLQLHCLMLCWLCLHLFCRLLAFDTCQTPLDSYQGLLSSFTLDSIVTEPLKPLNPSPDRRLDSE